MGCLYNYLREKMQNRIFLRTMLERFFDSVAIKAAVSFVKFCKEQGYFMRKELKFYKKMPLNNIEVEQKFDNRYIFNGKLKMEN